MSTSKQIIKKFQKQIDTNIDYHNEMLIALHGKTRKAALEAILAEQFVMSLAVQWEAFISDLIIAYVEQSPSKYLSNLDNRIKQSISSKYGHTALRRITFKKITNLSKDTLMKLIDKDGFNVTAKNSDDLSKKANEYLSAKYAKRFSLNSNDRIFIDFLINLRNYIGHKSKKSRSQLKKTIKQIKPTGPYSNLNEDFRYEGVYLRKSFGGNSRAILIANYLKKLSSVL